MHKILFYNKFIICFYMFRALCAHHQEVKIVIYSICYCHTSRWQSGTQVEDCAPDGHLEVWWYQMLYNTILTFWWRAQQCSKHVEAYNKLIIKKRFCASSWLITETNISKQFIDWKRVGKAWSNDTGSTQLDVYILQYHKFLRTRNSLPRLLLEAVGSIILQIPLHKSSTKNPPSISFFDDLYFFFRMEYNKALSLATQFRIMFLQVALYSFPSRRAYALPWSELSIHLFPPVFPSCSFLYISVSVTKRHQCCPKLLVFSHFNSKSRIILERCFQV